MQDFTPPEEKKVIKTKNLGKNEDESASDIKERVLSNLTKKKRKIEDTSASASDFLLLSTGAEEKKKVKKEKKRAED